jgi:hypothetical protein
VQPPIEFSQYLSVRYTDRLAQAGLAASVGSRGDSYDNAESCFGLFKAELIRPQGPWKGLDDVELATCEWVDWFNNRRLHSFCGDKPPVEYENAHSTTNKHLENIRVLATSLQQTQDASIFVKRPMAEASTGLRGRVNCSVSGATGW